MTTDPRSTAAYRKARADGLDPVAAAMAVALAGAADLLDPPELHTDEERRALIAGGLLDPPEDPTTPGTRRTDPQG